LSFVSTEQKYKYRASEILYSFALHLSGNRL